MWFGVCFMLGVRLDCDHHHFFHRPVDQLIHVHQRSLALAGCDPCEPAATASCETDSTRCRVLVNAMLREIDRLESGIMQRYDHGSDWIDLSSWSCESSMSVASTPPVAEHRNSIYGVPALGELAPGQTLRQIPAGDVVVSWLRVTNLGTLLDVLA